MRIALVGAELEENLSVRYIWATLEQAGHEVCFVRFNGPGDLETCAGTLAASGARVAGFSMVFTLRAAQFVGLARRAREKGFRGLILAGGAFAALSADDLLRDEPAFDAVAVGEGEGILRALAAADGVPDTVPGLVWRAPDGELRVNAPAVPPSDLDTLPEPVRLQPPLRFLGLPAVNVVSSRGCSHGCAFCSISAWHRRCGGERYRLRRPGAMAAEVGRLYRDGVRIFNFHDDNFLPPGKDAALERVRALEAAFREEKVGRIAFALKARADEVERETFGILKRMGLFRVFLGVEGSNAATLRRLGRGQGPDDNTRALGLLDALDLHVCFNLLVQDPDATLEDFRSHVAFIRTHANHPLNICRTEVYTGTPLEARLRGQGRLLGDYRGWDYRMGDPRSQRLFEIWWPAFEGRSHPVDCLHHLAMNVDFERQLAGHFFSLPADLDARSRDFVQTVNRNTAAHLDRAADRAESPLDATGVRQASRELAAGVSRDNRELKVEGNRLLLQIRTACRIQATSPERGPRGGRLSRVASWGLAAALAAGASTLTAAPEPCEPGKTEDSTGPTPGKAVSQGAAPASAAEREAPKSLKKAIRSFLWDNSRDVFSFLLLTGNMLFQDLVATVHISDDGRIVLCRLVVGGWNVGGKPPDAVAIREANGILDDVRRSNWPPSRNKVNNLKALGKEILPLLEERMKACKAGPERTWLETLHREAVDIAQLDEGFTALADVLSKYTANRRCRSCRVEVRFTRKEVEAVNGTMMCEVVAEPGVNTWHSMKETVIKGKELSDLPLK
ncbi:MAG: B12-binding domain-containing radical SAM protein [Acidobacteria bacterium]|nr:B12-binding domain-containing radical SAM protein [Acidobacteriota bacterium]